MELKKLAAAAALTAAIATPAFAQDPHARSAAVQQPQTQRMYHQRNDQGFWPADVAAGVVGGAIGTAGAIATAPFRNDAYAYNDGYGYNNGYAYNSYNQGFVCQPGTWFRGEDGQRHICQ